MLKTLLTQVYLDDPDQYRQDASSLRATWMETYWRLVQGAHGDLALAPLGQLVAIWRRVLARLNPDGDKESRTWTRWCGGELATDSGLLRDHLVSEFQFAGNKHQAGVMVDWLLGQKDRLLACNLMEIVQATVQEGLRPESPLSKDVIGQLLDTRLEQEITRNYEWLLSHQNKP